MKINERKTKLTRLNNKEKRKVTVNDKEIEDVEELIYIGAMVNKAGGSDESGDKAEIW